MYKFKKKLGESIVEIEGTDLKDLCFQSNQIPNIECCTACQCSKLTPAHRRVAKDGKNYDYYSIRCEGCGAEFKLGQKLEGGGLFYKYDTKFEKYVAPGQHGGLPKPEYTVGDPQGTVSSGATGNPPVSDLPF